MRAIKAGCRQTRCQSFVFEINGDKSQRSGRRNCRVSQQLLFPGLGGRVVDFEDTQALTEGITVGVGVKPRAEHHGLTDTILERDSQSVFREACSDGDEQSHAASGGVLLGTARNTLRVQSQDPNGQWIGEDRALLEHLVGGPVKGGGKRGLAWFPSLHAL
ncbi:hypothetical protein SBA2_10130 [Acidobacteriia bacterium SbA2]|nr:hypothetical protein SBA2_10130 [Acidobacteriia bacterium SbA2]